METADESDPARFSIDSLQEEHEQIEELLEELIIFPTQKGLRRLLKKIETHFLHEEKIMEHFGFSQHAYRTQADDQKRIINKVQNELHTPRQDSFASSYESCWIQAPKAIGDGIDKNVATEVAVAFSRHAERFYAFRSEMES